MNRQEYVDLIKSATLGAAKQGVLDYISAKLPSLFTGLIGKIATPILGFFVGKILSIAIEKTELGIFFLYTDFRVTAQGRDFEAYALANLNVRKNGTPEEIKNAEINLINAFRNFAKFNG